MAAKLSDIREYPYCVFIHSDTFKALPRSERYVQTESIWEERKFAFAGETHTVYRTKYFRAA